LYPFIAVNVRLNISLATSLNIRLKVPFISALTIWMKSVLLTVPQVPFSFLNTIAALGKKRAYLFSGLLLFVATDLPASASFCQTACSNLQLAGSASRPLSYVSK